MKYKYCAATNSTTHTWFDGDFVNEDVLRRHLNKFLKEYGEEEHAIVQRQDGKVCKFYRYYLKQVNMGIWQRTRVKKCEFVWNDYLSEPAI